jgi:hypothetical protein
MKVGQTEKREKNEKGRHFENCADHKYVYNCAMSDDEAHLSVSSDGEEKKSSKEEKKDSSDDEKKEPSVKEPESPPKAEAAAPAGEDPKAEGKDKQSACCLLL